MCLAASRHDIFGYVYLCNMLSLRVQGLQGDSWHIRKLKKGAPVTVIFIGHKWESSVQSKFDR